MISESLTSSFSPLALNLHEVIRRSLIFLALISINTVLLKPPPFLLSKRRSPGSLSAGSSPARRCSRNRRSGECGSRRASAFCLRQEGHSLPRKNLSRKECQLSGATHRGLHLPLRDQYRRVSTSRGRRLCTDTPQCCSRRSNLYTCSQDTQDQMKR